MLKTALIALACCSAALAMDYCPSFFQAQKSCTCYSYIDGAMVECDGPDSTDVIEQLKQSNVKIRLLQIKNADIIEVGFEDFCFCVGFPSCFFI